jgi:hypothetical protein
LLAPDFAAISGVNARHDLAPFPLARGVHLNP